MATISIALCTYNGERYLQEQLDSFVSQTRVPDELVICDDRSSDATPAIVERFITTAPFVVKFVVNDANLGSTRNFEKAIGLCTGDLIFLSDQDDVWMPEKMAVIEREFAGNEQAGMIFSDAELVDEDLKPLGKRLLDLTLTPPARSDIRNGRAFESLLERNFVTGATAAFRSRFREIVVPTPDDVPNLIHDGWIALSIANEAPIVFIDRPLIKYRQHSSQQIGLRAHREPDREERYAKTIKTLHDEAERLRMLKEILTDMPQFKVPNSIDSLIESKLQYEEHCRVRMTLPRSRALRAGPIVRELMTGRYGKFSKGLGSALKDVVEP